MRWRNVKQNRRAAYRKDSLRAEEDLEACNPQEFSFRLRKELGCSDSDKLFYAGFFVRGKAQVIDTFMIYMPLLYFLTYVVIGSAQEFRDSIWGPFIAVLIYGSVVALFLAKKGQTPGKKAYDLWVVRENGKKVTFVFALLRFFGFLLSGATIVGILSPLWRKDKRALHDKLFKTIVLKKC